MSALKTDQLTTRSEAAPNISLNIPQSWFVRESAFTVPTMPRCIVFASSENLPAPDAGNGEWDRPVYSLTDTGAALEVSVIDTSKSPAQWLNSRAVDLITAAGEWPTDPFSEVTVPLDHQLSLNELGADPLPSGPRWHRSSWYRLGQWAVLVEIWLGFQADAGVAQEVISSIRPA